MPDADVRKKWVVYQQGLIEWLPSRIHGVHTEYQIGCSELSVSVHEDL